MTIKPEEIDLRFTYHAPNDNQVERRGELRTFCHSLASLICASTPAGREQSIALLKLEECNMFANAAIARREDDTPY